MNERRMTGDVLADVRLLCERAAQLAQAAPTTAARIAAVRDRLDGPLRIAIAGRVKAGKSTLLNAMVGERLAATDAGSAHVSSPCSGTPSATS
jgi:tRNA U34 5-carboxymethylaminomethyl modifying GTPase MnmE/TrmE